MPDSASATRSEGLVTVDGRTFPLRSARIEARAEGGLASSTLIQEYANPYVEPLEVFYTMALPADGAVAGYAFTIGECMVTGTIERREEAQADYRKALMEGRTAGLLEQERADTFTQSLGNVPPGTPVTVRIDVPRADGEGTPVRITAEVAIDGGRKLSAGPSRLDRDLVLTCDDGYRYELSAWLLISEPFAMARHDRVRWRIERALKDLVTSRGLGDVFGEVGYILARGPDTVRGPDVSFVSKARLEAFDDTRFFPGAPRAAARRRGAGARGGGSPPGIRAPDRRALRRLLTAPTSPRRPSNRPGP